MILKKAIRGIQTTWSIYMCVYVCGEYIYIYLYFCTFMSTCVHRKREREREREKREIENFHTELTNSMKLYFWKKKGIYFSICFLLFISLYFHICKKSLEDIYI
jgi:hypothetical protein